MKVLSVVDSMVITRGDVTMEDLRKVRRRDYQKQGRLCDLDDDDFGSDEDVDEGEGGVQLPPIPGADSLKEKQKKERQMREIQKRLLRQRATEMKVRKRESERMGARAKEKEIRRGQSEMMKMRFEGNRDDNSRTREQVMSTLKQPSLHPSYTLYNHLYMLYTPFIPAHLPTSLHHIMTFTLTFLHHIIYTCTLLTNVCTTPSSPYYFTILLRHITSPYYFTLLLHCYMTSRLHDVTASLCVCVSVCLCVF